MKWKCCLIIKALIDGFHSASRVLSSFSVQGAGQEKLGIYIKSVVKGGAADVVRTKTKAGTLADDDEGEEESD